MLTGTTPFAAEGGFTAVLLRILRDDPVPPSNLRAEVPPDLDAVVAQTLAKEPSHRYASAHELIDDLERLLAGEDGVLVRPSKGMGSDSQGVAGSTRVPHAGRAPVTGGGQPTPPQRPTPRARSAARPKPRAPLVGRQDELAIAALHLSDPHCRILTLFGPGGTGKTRLALELAADPQLVERFSDGVVFVPLEALGDDSLITTAIAAALELTLHGQADVLDEIVDSIGERRMLIVLDNFEHLMAGADVPAVLAEGCPELVLLVTSRERLNLEEEWVLPIAGLPAPSQDALSQAEALAYDAVQLFVQRARRADVRFTLTEDDIPHVCDVCRLVQGSPMGVELAAAWVKTMPCAEISRALHANLDALESTSRNVSERHRSLRATFEYSWVLLDASEQDALRRLAVFRGGFTADAAREVTGASVARLAGLLDKSLLATPAAGRYDLHPLIHQFAHEKLTERPDDLERTEEAHGRYFLRLLQSHEQALGGHGYAEAYRILDVDLSNLRAAWGWAVAQRRIGDLVASVRPFDQLFDNKGRHREAAALFAHAVAGLDQGDASHHEALGAAASRQAWAMYMVGRLPEARQVAERGLSWLQPLGESAHLLAALNTLAAIEYALGRYAEAKTHWRHALALARSAGNSKHVSAILGNLASAEASLGDYDAGLEHQSESLRMARGADDPMEVIKALNNMGAILIEQGQLGQAQRYVEEALELARSTGRDGVLLFLLHSLGVMHLKGRAPEHAEPLFREALALARARGDEAREAFILGSLAGLRLALDDPGAALELLTDGLRIAWSNENLPAVLRCLIELARWHAHHDRLDDALSLLALADDHPAADRKLLDGYRNSIAEWEARLPPETAAAARVRGRSLRLEELVERALREPGAAVAA
jgi:predicted ATPase